MNFGSMFSGIGGFDIALERAGMTCSWQCEIDPKASAVLKRHWPNVPNVEDVRNVRHGNTESVGLICGGFPCQDLSVAGKRAGLAGERSGLFYEFARVVDEFAPGWVLAENVPGLLSSNAGKDFAIVIGGLTGIIPEVPEEGWQNAGIAWGPRYKVAWRILDAQYFGVAQRRRRVFIVGSLGNGRAAEVLFEREGMFGDPPSRRETGQRPARESESGFGGNGASAFITRRGEGHGENISPTLTHKSDGKSAHGAYDKIGVYQWASGGGDDIKDTAQSLRSEAEHSYQVVAYNIQANDGGDHKRKDRPNGGLYVNKTDQALTVGGTDLTAIIQPEIAPAISSKWAKQSGGPAGDETQNLVFDKAQFAGVRRLTPTECERLQGFPDGWTDGQADSTRYRQLGNAVAVPVVEWIARRIMAVEAG